jgi:hypothetical protein
MNARIRSIPAFMNVEQAACIASCKDEASPLGQPEDPVFPNPYVDKLVADRKIAQARRRAAARRLGSDPGEVRSPLGALGLAAAVFLGVAFVLVAGLWPRLAGERTDRARRMPLAKTAWLLLDASTSPCRGDRAAEEIRVPGNESPARSGVSHAGPRKLPVSRPARGRSPSRSPIATAESGTRGKAAGGNHCQVNHVNSNRRSLIGRLTHWPTRSHLSLPSSVS